MQTFDRRRLNTSVLVAFGSLLMSRIALGGQRRADLVITDLQWSDDYGLTWHNESVPAQSNVSFRAKVRNAGTAAFPAPKVIRVDFRVNGSLVAWSDTYRSGLSAGASKILVANSGWGDDAVWHDAPAGTRTILARIDPLNSYTELNESNNTRSATLAVDPLSNSPEIDTNLPFCSQYYGGTPFGASSAANLKLRASALPGDSFFFRADRTGVVDRILMHWRRYTGGYAAGSGGTYTIQIRAADPTTRLPIVTGSPICEVTGINPGTTSTNGWSNRVHTFTTTGKLVMKQPYCIVWLNTHPNRNAPVSKCSSSTYTAYTQRRDQLGRCVSASTGAAGSTRRKTSAGGWPSNFARPVPVVAALALGSQQVGGGSCDTQGEIARDVASD